MERKRLTAIKARIRHVVTGTYITQPGFESNYVLTDAGIRHSRVRIMATIVDKFLSESGKLASITLDDGTATIRAKIFNTSTFFDKVSIGDVVDLVGRLREYQGEIFILPETVKKIDNPNWELLRELEIRGFQKEWSDKRSSVIENSKQTSDMDELKKIMKERYAILPEDVETIMQSVSAVAEEAPQARQKDIILRLITELDPGEGCDYSELISRSGMPEDAIDSVVEELLEEGSCFEPRPGKIKKL